MKNYLNFETEVKNLEKELVEFSKFRPITLILPSLFSELKGPALPKIVQEISKVKYINHIVIGLLANADLSLLLRLLLLLHL